MNVTKLWMFLKKGLSSRWLWIVLGVALVAATSKSWMPVLTSSSKTATSFLAPFMSTIGQIVLGIIISPFLILFVWIVILSVFHGEKKISWSKVGSFLGGVVVLVVVCWVGYRGYKWWTKPPAPQNPTAAQVVQPPTVIVSQAPVPTFHPFGTDGCYETNLGYEARWSPKDKAIRVYDPAGDSHVEALGKKSPISAFGPSRWRFCKEDPDATGVVIWE